MDGTAGITWIANSANGRTSAFLNAAKQCVINVLMNIPDSHVSPPRLIHSVIAV